jgi:hypothetical protein
MTVDPEHPAAQSRQAQAEALRQAAEMEQSMQEPAHQQELLRQNNVIYGALIAVGLVFTQPFLTSTPHGWSATICVIAFAVAIPLLAALFLVNRHENFRGRATSSLLVRVTQSAAQLAAFAGLVAGFWHIAWVAGLVTLISSLVAMGVHSAGYFRLEQALRQRPAGAGSGRATPSR